MGSWSMMHTGIRALLINLDWEFWGLNKYAGKLVRIWEEEEALEQGGVNL